MAKSSVRLAVDDTWTSLENYGEWARDARTVKGFNTGHEGGSQVLDDDSAERVEEALRWLLTTDYMMHLAVVMYFRGEKVERRAEGNVPVVYYVPLNYRQIGGKFDQGYSWAQGMVSGGVCMLEGRLSL